MSGYKDTRQASTYLHVRSSIAAQACCFRHWAYATSSTQFYVDLKTVMIPDLTIPNLPAGMGVKQHATAVRVHQRVLMWHVLMWPQTGQTSVEPHAVKTTLKTDPTVAVVGSETRPGLLCPQRNREALVGSHMGLLAIPKPHWSFVAHAFLG